MAKEALYNFIPERLLKKQNTVAKKESHTVTINAKHSIMMFSTAYVRDNNIRNKYIKFYADTTKKAIAWKIVHETNLSDLAGMRKLKGHEQITSAGKSVSYSLGIKSLLKSLNLKSTKTFKKLEVKKYASKALLEDPLHYVEIK